MFGEGVAKHGSVKSHTRTSKRTVYNKHSEILLILVQKKITQCLTSCFFLEDL